MANFVVIAGLISYGFNLFAEYHATGRWAKNVTGLLAGVGMLALAASMLLTPRNALVILQVAQTGAARVFLIISSVLVDGGHRRLRHHQLFPPASVVAPAPHWQRLASRAASHSLVAGFRKQCRPLFLRDSRLYLLHWHSCGSRLEWLPYAKPFDRDSVRYPCLDRLDAAGASSRGNYCRTQPSPGVGKHVCTRLCSFRGPRTINLDAPAWS